MQAKTQKQSKTLEQTESLQPNIVETPAKQAKAPEAPTAYTKPGYEVPTGEENDVHVVLFKELVSKSADGRTIVKEIDTTHKLDPKMWKQCRLHWAAQGWFWREALHLPVGCESGLAIAETQTI